MKFYQTYFLPLQNRINSTTFVDNSRSCCILVTFWYERYLTNNKHFDVDADLVQVHIQDLFTGISTTAACRIESKIQNVKKWAELLSNAPGFDSSWHTYQEGVGFGLPAQ